MTRICVTLTEPDTEGALRRMAELADVADLFEVRADLMASVDLQALREGAPRPLVLTCRAASQGGQMPDGDPARRATLVAALDLGFDYVDVEAELLSSTVKAHADGRRLVLSHHDLTGTPGDLEGRYVRMCESGPEVVKIAVTPRTFADVGRVLALCEWVGEHGQVPLIAIAMGRLGMLTRLLAGRYDAPWTYAASATGREAAPGQLGVDAMAHAYRVRDVSRKTRVYGLVGTDVSRSLSPALHNRAFAERGLDAIFVPISADDLGAFWNALPLLGLSGFSVTRPYKGDVVSRLSSVDEAARRMASVNTVVRNGNGWVGASTDGAGVVMPLRERMTIAGRSVVILGAGGAARAAADALAAEGARITMLARDPARAAEAAARSGASSGPLASLPDLEWDVLVQA
ncbi:MAG TPA: type I 3-dehydroquinate dehydratase, partial [Vicinamibacteria bacterium]|nr:type I 3-dehydroquinate dehydratase [Vicinamibacteria bacterium]